MNVVGLFADITNLYYCIGKRFNGKKLDYKKYLDKASVDHQMYRAFAYGTQSNDEAIDFITCLRYFGYDPKYKAPKQFEGKEPRKVDWDVGIAMDVVRLIDKLDVVMIGSADGDLVPLVQWVKEKGRKCVIFACGISKDLKEAADVYIEIKEDLLKDDNATDDKNKGLPDGGGPSERPAEQSN